MDVAFTWAAAVLLFAPLAWKYLECIFFRTSAATLMQGYQTGLSDPLFMGNLNLIAFSCLENFKPGLTQTNSSLAKRLQLWNIWIVSLLPMSYEKLKIKDCQAVCTYVITTGVFFISSLHFIAVWRLLLTHQLRHLWISQQNLEMHVLGWGDTALFNSSVLNIWSPFNN